MTRSIAPLVNQMRAGKILDRSELAPDRILSVLVVVSSTATDQLA